MKTNKRFLALCLALLLACVVLPAPAAQGADVQPVLSAALAQQAAAVPSPGYGDEWTVLGLARGGYFAVDSDYFAHYYADVAAKAPELTAASGRDGALNAYKSTDNSRVILALSAIGRDATQVGGCDLTAPYADFSWVRNQGINGPVFALLALDSRNYLPGSAVRRQCVDAILSAELSGGGFADSGSHILDMCRYILDDQYDSLVARAYQLAPDCGAKNDEETFMLVTAQMKSGVTASLYETYAYSGTGEDISFEVLGSKGSMRWSGANPSIFQLSLQDDDRRMSGHAFRNIILGPAHPRGNSVPPLPGFGVGVADNMAFEVCDIINAYCGGYEYNPNFADAWDIIKLCDEIRVSEKTKQWVTCD